MAASEKHDEKVNPKHYSSLGPYSANRIIQAWNKFRREVGGELVGFNVGNALKYIQRAGLKSGEAEVVDLKKAIWYLKNRIYELDPTEEDPAGND